MYNESLQQPLPPWLEEVESYATGGISIKDFPDSVKEVHYVLI